MKLGIVLFIFFFLSSSFCHLIFAGQLNLSPKEKQGLSFIAQYPQAELWRIFVDGRLHSSEGGWLGYELREPGSLKNLFEALTFAVSNFDTVEFNMDFMNHLHFIITSDLKNPRISEFDRGAIRDRIVGFVIEKNRATTAGLVQLFKEIKNQKIYPEYQGAWLGKLSMVTGTLDMKTAIHAYSISRIKKQKHVRSSKKLASKLIDDVNAGEYHYLAPRPSILFEEINRVFLEYNESMLRVNGDEEKLKIIAKHIQRLELLHPYSDGNGRVIVNLLLNLMLMKNGFAPATFEEPNLFDLYSVDELVLVIKDAIANTMRIIDEGENTDIFAFKTSSMSNDDQQAMSRWTKAFVEVRTELTKTE